MKQMMSTLSTSRYEDIESGDGTRTRVLVLGSETLGCKYCKSVSVKFSENAKVKIYHPSTECCKRAVNAQLSFRNAEIEQLKKRMREDDNAVVRLEEEAASFGDSKMGTAEQARYKAQKARAGYIKKSSEVYQLRIRELSAEINRLRKKKDFIDDAIEANS